MPDAADGRRNMSSTPPKDPWFTSRRWKLLAFYLGVPLIVGLYGGINNWQLLKQAGYLPGLLFYLAHAIPPWLTTCFVTFAVMWALRRIKPSPWIIMGIGSVLAAFIAQPFAAWLTTYYEIRWNIPELHDQVAPMFSVEFWRYLISATVMWYLINYIFDRFLGLPRYRYTIPRGYDFKDAVTDSREPDATQSLPGFFERIPLRLKLEDVLAVKAEQHYIRVYTDEQDYMILYRFSDAVREMPEDSGFQVHRSYWVSYAGVESIRPRAKKFLIHLVNGENVPVSGPYHAPVKEAAREHNWVVIS